MPLVDFSKYDYYPALLCSPSEHMGYRELSNADKDAILPIFELSQIKRGDNFQSSKDTVATSAEAKPFILDLYKVPAPRAFVSKDADDDEREQAAQLQASQDRYNEELEKLLNQKDGFIAWRTLVREFPHAIPVIQFTDPKAQALQILRQGAMLSKECESMAIRITDQDGPEVYDIISQIISILDAPDRLLVILDCGYARQKKRREQMADFAWTAIEKITKDLDISQRPLLRITCISSSYSNPTHRELDTVENKESALWCEVREMFPVMFGDYGAFFRRKNPTTFIPSDWNATVTYPTEEHWHTYKDPNARRQDGWSEGAAEINALDDFANAPDVWGTEIIRKAANGDIQGVASQRFWHAARINIHLHQQIGFARAIISETGEDDDGDDN